MDINTSVFLGLFAQILFATLQGACGTHHTLSWKICGNQSLYRVSDHGSNFLVGDTLEFGIVDKRNDIARVMSESEYEACRAEDSTAGIYKGGEGIELNTSGIWYFMSRISDRCKSGEKVTISVVSGSVVKNQSIRMGRGGGTGGGTGGGGSGSGGMGNAGGFNTPKGNRDHPSQKNDAGALTRPHLIVLLAVYSILFNIC
ncbi:hypothetical protein SUGI_1191860 [Cryptomeria japonica]|uniref:umecyanin n=1 Tax=Cryptomeria japonica TaxID=3369 RepID=UPI002414CB89|nr:umecyanin [Cryptomeria japonica]GLJ55507.1 hypothetical protein SUGI_1191860 [Cryptomeria japonica]